MGRVPCPARKRSSGERDYFRSILRFDKLTVPRKIEGQPGFVVSSAERLFKSLLTAIGGRCPGLPATQAEVDITPHYRILSRLLREERVGVRFRTGASALNCVPVRRRWRWLGSLGALSSKRKFLAKGLCPLKSPRSEARSLWLGNQSRLSMLPTKKREQNLRF